MTIPPISTFFFFFNDTATTEIYTLSLHDALPISAAPCAQGLHPAKDPSSGARGLALRGGDRKSTRLNSSHSQISYAVFCLKKKKKRQQRCQSECASMTKHTPQYFEQHCACVRTNH